MSPVKYHISPTTGRANKCKAFVKGCPLKSEDGVTPQHFDSKEAANAHIEAEAKKANPNAMEGLKRKAPEDPQGEARAAAHQRIQELLKEVQTVERAHFAMVTSAHAEGMVQAREDLQKALGAVSREEYLKVRREEMEALAREHFNQGSTWPGPLRDTAQAGAYTVTVEETYDYNFGDARPFLDVAVRAPGSYSSPPGDRPVPLRFSQRLNSQKEAFITTTSFGSVAPGEVRKLAARLREAAAVGELLEEGFQGDPAARKDLAADDPQNKPFKEGTMEALGNLKPVAPSRRPRALQVKVTKPATPHLEGTMATKIIEVEGRPVVLRAEQLPDGTTHTEIEAPETSGGGESEEEGRLGLMGTGAQLPRTPTFGTLEEAPSYKVQTTSYGEVNYKEARALADAMDRDATVAEALPGLLKGWQTEAEELLK